MYKFRDDKVITYDKDGNIIEEQQYVLKQTESEGYDGEIYEDHKYGYLHVTYTDGRFDRYESEYDVNDKWLWTKGYKENKVVYENSIEEDGTRVEKFYDNNGNVVSVSYEYMQGKGNVIRRMFREIDAQCYIMVDGDDTYPMECAAEMVDKVLYHNADMVVGDRLSTTYFTENKRPFHNFGNSIVRGSINILFKSEIKDIMTGYRAFSYHAFWANMDCKCGPETHL